MPVRHQRIQFSLKIDDANGAIDEVNLVFNQAGSGPDVTLTGTNGKDVIYATGLQRHTDRRRKLGHVRVP